MDYLSGNVLDSISASLESAEPAGRGARLSKALSAYVALMALAAAAESPEQVVQHLSQRCLRVKDAVGQEARRIVDNQVGILLQLAGVEDVQPLSPSSQQQPCPRLALIRDKPEVAQKVHDYVRRTSMRSIPSPTKEDLDAIKRAAARTTAPDTPVPPVAQLFVEAIVDAAQKRVTSRDFQPQLKAVADAVAQASREQTTSFAYRAAAIIGAVILAVIALALWYYRRTFLAR